MPVALTPLFLVLIILPTITYYLALTTSLAVGSCAAAVILLARFIDPLLSRELSTQRASGEASPLVIAVSIIALIAAHAAVAWTFQSFDGARAAGSALILVIIILAGCALGDALHAATDRGVDRAARTCFALFCLVAAVGVTGISPQTPMTSAKALFPFTEPSHFALIFGPFFLFGCARSRGTGRLLVLLVGVAIAATLQNLTLFVVAALAAVLCLRGLVLIPIIGLLAVALVGMELVDLTYYTERLDMSGDNTNLSALVYLQGWQLVGESWERSHGWGLGFQQLGMHGTEVPAADLIFAMTSNEGNLRDGGFDLAKVTSEFGVIGVLLILWFVRRAWRAVREVRAIARRGHIRSGRLFSLCVVIAYLVEIFVRGTGYFSSTGVLLVAALWYLRNDIAPDRK